LVDQQGSEHDKQSATHPGQPIIEFDANTFGDAVLDCRLDHLYRFGLKAELFEEGANV
jgi:hypothetical protein